jgi:hypothetical protein
MKIAMNPNGITNSLTEKDRRREYAKRRAKPTSPYRSAPRPRPHEDIHFPNWGTHHRLHVACAWDM